MAVSALGLLLFVSVFFTFMDDFGNFDNFEGRAKNHMTRSIGGMGLLIAGGFMIRLGRRGAAGSGLVLDPEQAREDLEPWSRMGGGMVNDALEEVDVLQDLKGEDKIKVRCRSCKALNDEGAKFCDQCGAEM